MFVAVDPATKCKTKKKPFRKAVSENFVSSIACSALGQIYSKWTLKIGKIQGFQKNLPVSRHV
jgi:hypothetical protein